MDRGHWSTAFAQFTSEEPTLGCPGGQTGGNPFPSPSRPGPINQRNLNANFRSNINQLMYAASLQWNIMGRAGYGEGDIAYSESPQMVVGGGYALQSSHQYQYRQCLCRHRFGQFEFPPSDGDDRQCANSGTGSGRFFNMDLGLCAEISGFSFQSESGSGRSTATIKACRVCRLGLRWSVYHVRAGSIREYDGMDGAIRLLRHPAKILNLPRVIPFGIRTPIRAAT